MGDAADMLFEQELKFQIEAEHELNWRFNNDIWTTKTGETMKISEMETSHIKNSIRFIKRNGAGREWIPKLRAELAKRIDK